ncbi:MAG: hypothetical protein IPP90_11205 [Gemmatimonadaceae bacterium]|nr:hypothetical protein [Gemmatimonadaceae bacterium]
MHLRLVHSTPRLTRRRGARRRQERPSLAVAVARSLALALFIMLTMLSQVARGQGAPPAAAAKGSPSTGSASTGSASTGSASTGSASTAASHGEPGVGSALRRSADRHGLWGSLGIGRATAGLHCDACVRETTRAYAVHGTLGVRLSSRFLVGAETFAWLDVIGGGVDRIARGTYLVARTYPFEGSPLFLHGGLGVASFQVNDGTVAFTTRSPSLSIAAGYDWRVGEFTVTPTLTALTSTGGRLNSDRTGNAVTSNARLGMLRTSVALSWFR